MRLNQAGEVTHLCTRHHQTMPALPGPTHQLLQAPPPHQPRHQRRAAHEHRLVPPHLVQRAVDSLRGVHLHVVHPLLGQVLVVAGPRVALLLAVLCIPVWPPPGAQPSAHGVLPPASKAHVHMRLVEQAHLIPALTCRPLP